MLGFLYSMVLIPARNAVFPGSLVWTKLLIQECHRRCVFTGLVGGDRFPVGSCCPQPWVCTRAKEATCSWQTAKWFPKTDGYILTVHDPFFSELACQRSSTNITNMLSFFLSLLRSCVLKVLVQSIWLVNVCSPIHSSATIRQVGADWSSRIAIGYHPAYVVMCYSQFFCDFATAATRVVIAGVNGRRRMKSSIALSAQRRYRKINWYIRCFWGDLEKMLKSYLNRIKNRKNVKNVFRLSDAKVDITWNSRFIKFRHKSAYLRLHLLQKASECLLVDRTHKSEVEVY